MRKMKDSGIEWIGEIPEAWRRTKLKNLIIESNSGEVIDRSYWNIGDEILYSCSKATIMCNYSKFPKHKRTVKGDLLLTRNATPYIFIPEENAIYTNVVQRIKLNDKVNLRFIKYMLESSRSSIKGYGDIIESFNMNVWGNTWCTIPSIEEQELIADYLDNKVKEIDNIISKTKETIEEYKKYKQSVITEAVTKGLNPNVEMKDSGIEWIGEIPKHWNINNLNQIFYQLKDKNSNMEEENLLSLSYGNIIRKNINSNNGLLPENFSGYNIIKKGDIVLRLTDLQNDHTSLRTGLAKEKGIITSAYVTLRRKEKIDTEYYHLYLHSFDIYKGFYGMGSGVRQGLTFEGIKYLKILSPSIEERYKIVEFCYDKIDKIDNLISKKQNLITELEQYKKSLIYEYVTGKKEVAPAYAY